MCTWNVRGLNNPVKIREIKQFVLNNKLTLFALLETGVKAHNHERIMNKFGRQWKWAHNYGTLREVEFGLPGIHLW